MKDFAKKRKTIIGILFLTIFSVIMVTGATTFYTNYVLPGRINSSDTDWHDFPISGFDDSSQYTIFMRSYDAYDWYPYPIGLVYAYTNYAGYSENAASTTDAGYVTYYSKWLTPASSGNYRFYMYFDVDGSLRHNYQSPSYARVKWQIVKDSAPMWTSSWNTLVSDSGSSSVDSSWASSHYDYFSTSSSYQVIFFLEFVITGDNGWFSPQEEVDFHSGTCYSCEGQTYGTNYNYRDHFDVIQLKIT